MYILLLENYEVCECTTLKMCLQKLCNRECKNASIRDESELELVKTNDAWYSQETSKGLNY